MSLRAPIVYCIPEETARVAHAAFPKGNPYLRMRDTLGPIYINPEFAALFPNNGQPAEAPAHLALVTVMQFAEGLSDRQAADAVRARLDWKYALALDLTDPGFDASVLSEFRRRLLTGNAELLLFETMLTLFREQGLVKAKGRQRTDSTHVLAAIHVLNRLECIGETVRHALNTLAVAAPDWLRSWVPTAWFERYGDHFEEYRLPPGKPERYALAAEIGTDGLHLLHRVYDHSAPGWLREVPAVEILRQVWVQQFYAALPDDAVTWRTAEDLPPAPLLISSPYDPEARYSRKRETEWVGYKVHITETCDDDTPNLLTDVTTTAAPTPDHAVTAKVQEHLAARELRPAEHIVDAGYMTAEQLVTSRTERSIELVGPVPADPSWQTRAGEGFGTAHFVVDWEAEQATCPEGKQSVVWKALQDRHGHDVVSIRWNQAACGSCPVRSKCVSSSRPRALMLRTQAQHEALQAARERQRTELFQTRYHRRAGIEGTLSQGTRISDLRRSRYIGEAKTRLLHVLIGAAMNFVRVAAWLAERPRAQTRRSAFAVLGAVPT
jgi:transposase